MAIDNGFEELAVELERMARQITNKSVKRKVLEAGAKPVVDYARRTMQQYRRTGRLDQGITSAYNEKDETQDIGWGNKGFYGRFYESGYRPIAGNLKRTGGRRKWQNKRPSGKFIKRQHIQPAYATERENVSRAMIEVYKNEV